jgi:hypothetical protein
VPLEMPDLISGQFFAAAFSKKGAVCLGIFREISRYHIMYGISFGCPVPRRSKKQVPAGFAAAMTKPMGLHSHI